MESNTTASNAHKILSLLGALLIVLVGGALIGLLTAVVGSVCYLVFVFPIAMGIAGGKVARWAVRAANVRKTGQVIALAVLTALVLYGTFHYGRYLALQVQSALLLASKLPETGGSDLLMLGKVAADYGLKQETSHTGFLGYMLYKAKSGISIGRFYSQNRLELTSFLAWLYWVVELGVIIWITMTMAKRELLVPVCEACGKRLGGEKHLGGTAPANESLLLELLQRNELAELGLLLEKDAGLPSLELYLQRCEACGGSTATLTVRRAELGTRGYVAFLDVSKATLQPRDSALFLDQLRYELE
jgi:hypothetical protein